MSPSTCNDAKQCGQWFLHVLDATGISWPQFTHINDSFIFFMIEYFSQKKEPSSRNRIDLSPRVVKVGSSYQSRKGNTGSLEQSGKFDTIPDLALLSPNSIYIKIEQIQENKKADPRIKNLPPIYLELCKFWIQSNPYFTNQIYISNYIISSFIALYSETA